MAKHMENDYALVIPEFSNFNMIYYCRFSSSVYDARVYPPHVHDFLEFYILIEGDVSFMIDGNIYHLQAGDVVISRPNQMHHCVLNNRSVHKHMCIWFNTSTTRLISEFLDKQKKSILSPSEKDKSTLLSLYYELESAGIQANELHQFSTALSILDLYSKAMKDPEMKDITLQTIPAILREIIDDINDNFVNIHSLDYFTEKYFISMSTLNRLFKKHLHTSPKLYLESKRLTYSRLLLKEGRSVLSACVDSGFPDYSNYIRLFKNRFGITPKQYKDSK